MTDEEIFDVLHALFAKHLTVQVTPQLLTQWKHTVLSGVSFGEAMHTAKQLANDFATPACASDFDRALKRFRGEPPEQVDKQKGHAAIENMRKQHEFLNNERKAVGQ